jgi:uncharacterized delta-60 repeat protein
LLCLALIFFGIIFLDSAFAADLSQAPKNISKNQQIQSELDTLMLARKIAPGIIPNEDYREMERGLHFGLCADPKGKCTWERTFGGAQEDKAYGIATMLDDGVVVVGNRRFLSTTGQRAWILRLDRAGKMVWQREFGGLNSDQVYSVVTTSEDGVVVAGHTTSRGAGKSDVWVFRLDRDGNLVWDKTFGGAENDRARTIAATDDGGFVIAGSTQLPGKSEQDGWILKLRANGELSWEHTFGGDNSDGIFNVASTPDGGLVATGYTDMGSPKGYDLWVVRFDSGGKQLWDRAFGRGIFDAGTSIVATADGGSLVAGVTSADGYRADDAWVLRLNHAGEVLWEQTYGGPEPDTAWAIVKMPDAGFAVLVATSSYGAGSADAWLLRLDKDGALLWQRMYGGKLWDRPTSAVLTTDGGLFIAGYTTTQGSGYEDYWLFRLDAEGRF